MGDAVLELLVSEYLYSAYPDEDEGQLTHRRAAIVCEESLAAFVRGQGIQKFILFGRSEEHSGGREKTLFSAISANLCWAPCIWTAELSRPVFMSSGLLQFAEDEAPIKKSQDYKTELQIFLQKDGEADLQYQVLRTEGPPHDTTFYVRLVVEGRAFSEGKGNLRSAQSRRLLERL